MVITAVKMKAKKWVLVKHFDGVPKEENLEIQEEELPELQDGGQCGCVCYGWCGCV